MAAPDGEFEARLIERERRWAQLPESPPPDIRFRKRLGLISSLRDVWSHREAVGALVERQLRARYKQQLLSWGWAMINPLALMIIFTLVISRVAEVETNGKPYALFSYLGLLPWTFLATTLTQASNSLLSNKSLLNKVYCPREMFPLAALAVAFIDTLIASTALVVLFVFTATGPASTLWVAPILLALLAVIALAGGLFLSVVVVFVRDVRNMIPLILQVGLFASPVAYGLEDLPERWVAAYSLVNPVAPVINGLRRCVLYGQMPQWDLVGLGAAGALLALVVSYAVFRRLEGGIADVA